MCGILGIYNIKDNQLFNTSLFRQSLNEMAHRGPDASAIAEYENAIFGHLRLSIIDLNNNSNQPFELQDRYSLIFNGEIYNYLELKEELIKKGYTFKTNSDTEVLIQSFDYWGEDCVKRFNGMWAFAIYDKKNNSLFCSRDRFGVKPFNYSIVEGQLIFSSEIKSIIKYFPVLKNPNYKVIANYCRTSIGAQHKETWFKDVFRLQPGFNISIKKSEINIYRYWNYPKKIDLEIKFEEAVDSYRKLFKDAVKLRMRSDVPVGLTLSSGLDSSSIACTLKENRCDIKHTYTASFQNNIFHKSEKANFNSNVTIDEPFLVNKLTSDIGLVPTFIDVDYSNYIGNLKKIIWHLESGHGSPAIYPLDQVLKRAKEDVIVILEGQGADELLGGYIVNVMPYYFLKLVSNLKFKKAFNELKIFSKTYSLSSALKLFIRNSELKFLKKIFYKLSGIDKLLIGPLQGHSLMNDYPQNPKGCEDSINSHLYKAHTGGLVNLLHYGDAISMSHSMESRLPFMDYRLVEFVFSLPAEFKVRMGLGKYIHRISMEGIVPDYILNNPFKFGFDSPLKHLFLESSDNGPKSILLSEKFFKRGLFSRKAILKCLSDLEKGKKDYSRILFRILSVELWFQKFIDDECN
jgi:asparagine synthase (glutamine-hydrolysing)